MNFICGLLNHSTKKSNSRYKLMNMKKNIIIQSKSTLYIER